ncbi:MAG: hypothetical protein IK044_05640 [Methanobrevibacter sp.]|nr:hypothetical protein [Methanobrevibacter sp.]
MNSKNIFLALILIVIALALVSNVSAADNGTANDNITQYEDSIVTNLDFEQSSEPSVVNKGDIFEARLSVTNIGSETYHNLTIYYPLPAGLEVLIYPVEYQNDSMWVIDTLYPNETNYLTLICSALISNTTYVFTASVDNETVSTTDVYCQPDIVPPDNNNTSDISHEGLIKSISEGNSLKETANPILLLLFTIIFIPFIRLKY